MLIVLIFDHHKLVCRWKNTGEWGNDRCLKVWKEERNKEEDKNCDEVIRNVEIGFCECSNLNKTMRTGCQKGEFQTCFTACGGTVFNVTILSYKKHKDTLIDFYLLQIVSKIFTFRMHRGFALSRGPTMSRYR